MVDRQEMYRLSYKDSKFEKRNLSAYNLLNSSTLGYMSGINYETQNFSVCFLPKQENILSIIIAQSILNEIKCEDKREYFTQFWNPNRLQYAYENNNENCFIDISQNGQLIGLNNLHIGVGLHNIHEDINLNENQLSHAIKLEKLLEWEFIDAEELLNSQIRGSDPVISKYTVNNLNFFKKRSKKVRILANAIFMAGIYKYAPLVKDR